MDLWYLGTCAWLVRLWHYILWHLVGRDKHMSLPHKEKKKPVMWILILWEPATGPCHRRYAVKSSTSIIVVKMIYWFYENEERRTEPQQFTSAIEDNYNSQKKLISIKPFTFISPTVRNIHFFQWGIIPSSLSLSL